jgi:hypothetical protein
MLFMSSETFRTLRANEPVVSTKFLWGLSRALSVSIRKAAKIMAASTFTLPTESGKSKSKGPGSAGDEPIKLERDDSKAGYIYRDRDPKPSSKSSSRSKSRTKSGRTAAGQTPDKR